MNGDKINNHHDRDNILRAIFDQSFQFIGLMTLEGILIDVNRTAVKFAGAKEEDVIGKPFWETPWWIHSKELQEKLKDSIKKVAQGETVRFEATHKDIDGKIHIVDFSLKPVKDENGDVIYMIPEGRDITEQKKNEEKIKTILNTVPYGIAELNSKAEFEYNNNSYFSLVGYKPEELIGRRVTDFFPSEESVKEFDVYFENLLKTKPAPSPWVGKIKRKDGVIIDLQSDWQYKTDEEGNVTGVIIVSTDITQIKKAEEATKMYELLFKTSADAIMTMDPATGRFTSGNPATIKMFNVKDEKEFMALGPWDLSPEKQPDGEDSMLGAKEAIEKAMSEGSNFFEWTHKRYNGENFLATVLLSKVKLGEHEFIQATVRDISKQKKSEKELKQSEEKYRSLFENSQMGMYRSRLDGTAILDVNKKFVEIFGYADKSELIGKPSAIVYPDIKVRQEMVSQIKKGNGLLTNHETKFIRKDGNIISCLMSAKSFPEQGVLEGTIVDITDRKKIEQDLMAKSGEIEKMNKLMIGRELKMVELKNEIARLKGEKA